MHKPSVPHCRMVEGKAEAQRGQENGPGAQLAGWKSSGVRTAPLGAFQQPPPACCCPSLLFGSGCSWPTLPFISLSVPPPHGLSLSGGRLPHAPEPGGRAVWGEARWGGLWVGEQAGGRSDGEMAGRMVWSQRHGRDSRLTASTDRRICRESPARGRPGLPALRTSLQGRGCVCSGRDGDKAASLYLVSRPTHELHGKGCVAHILDEV